MKILSAASPKPTILTVSMGASPEHCEDGNPVAYRQNDQILMAVFDGVGGRQGGAIASAIASQTLNAALQQADVASLPWFTALQQQISDRLRQHSETLPTPKIRRKNNRRLCTTLACVHASLKFKSNQLRVGWIGDSRIYWLDPTRGLQQITQDDLLNPIDAFELAWNDQPMSQVLSADMESDWCIHYWQGNIPSKKGFLIVCTDGAFQHLQAPWYVELFWLQSLYNANSWEEWQQHLTEHYQHYRNDDVTLLIAPVGFKKLTHAKNEFKERYTFIATDFVTPDNTPICSETLEQQWAEYRVGYEALLVSNDTQRSDPDDNTTTLSTVEHSPPSKKKSRLKKYITRFKIILRHIKRRMFHLHPHKHYGKL